jgi:Carbohydrate-selective porin, OprB family
MLDTDLVWSKMATTVCSLRPIKWCGGRTMKRERKDRRWARAGGAPAERNLVTSYADGGVSLLAPLPGRNEDVLAIGAACSKVSHHASQFNQSEMACYKVKPYLL